MSRRALWDTTRAENVTSPLPGVELQGQRVTSGTLQTVVMRYVVAGQMAPGCRMLEMGCGPGIGLEYLSACGASRVVGADRNVQLLRMARERASADVALMQCDAAHMPFRDASFDSVLLLEVLMYFTDPASVLREVCRILGDRGTVLLTMPNAGALGVHRSEGVIHFYSETEVRRLLLDAGFVAEVSGAFPLRMGAKSKASWQRIASRILDGLERVGLPRQLRTRLTSAALRKNCRLPERIHTSHRSLLAEGEEGASLPFGAPDNCRVLYARGVVVQG